MLKDGIDEEALAIKMNDMVDEIEIKNSIPVVKLLTNNKKRRL